MTCQEVADFIMDYFSGELPPNVRDEFDRHLSICPNCVKYLATYKAAVALGRGAFREPEADAETEVPEDLVQAILASRSR